jgi:hypothetical protein
MDILKLRDQLEDALTAAFEKYDIHKLVHNAGCDVLAVTLMSPIWEEFEPKLLDGIVELQKPALGAGFEEWARDYCRRVHGVEVNLTTCDDSYLFALPRDLYAAWVASADAGAPSDADLVDAESDINDAQSYRWLQSLTDDYIDKIAESMPGGLDGFLKGWGWRQYARAVLAAAPRPGADGDE